MAIPKFRLSIGQPAIQMVKTGGVLVLPSYKGTGTKNVFTEQSAAIASIIVEQHNITKLESTIHVNFWDPTGEILDGLPDPETKHIPIFLEEASAIDPNGNLTPTFDGYMTNLSGEEMSPRTCNLVGHDKTFQMRTQSRYQTYQNLTSVQLVEKIAKDYGLTLDVDIGPFDIVRVSYDIGLSGLDGIFTDWDHITRALYADGLDAFMDPKSGKLMIRHLPTSVLRNITRGKDQLISVRPSMSYLGDGQQTLSKLSSASVASTPPLDEQGKTVSASNFPQQTTDNTGGVHGVPKTSSDDAHNRLPDRSQSGRKSKKRAKKNELDVVMLSTPDIGLDTRVNMKGFSSHTNGVWYTRKVRRTILPGSEMTTHSFTFMRSGAAKDDDGQKLSKVSTPPPGISR